MQEHKHPVNRVLEQLAQEYIAAGFPKDTPTSGDWILVLNCNSCLVHIHARADYMAMSGHLTPERIAFLAVPGNRVEWTNEMRHMIACHTCSRRIEAFEKKERQKLANSAKRHLPRHLR